MTLPFAGHPGGLPQKEDAKSEKDLIQSAYRFLLADLMPFGKRAEYSWNMAEKICHRNIMKLSPTGTVCPKPR